MGGTITGVGSSPDQTASYECGVLDGNELLREIPHVASIAQVRMIEQTDVGSPDVCPGQLLRLTQDVQRELESAGTDGVIITHGTDTLETTAFWLEMTLKSDKPVVVVGAMRPSTAYSADGVMNMLCAINLAVSPTAHRRGVMIAMCDRIYRPRYTAKTHANFVDAFEALGPGQLGIFHNTQPVFYCQPCQPLNHTHFNLSMLDAHLPVPAVEILHFYSGMSMRPAKDLLTDPDTRGIVLAGAGAGCWSTALGKAITRYACSSDIPLVVSMLPVSGFVGSGDIYGLGEAGIRAGFLNPLKCRVLLQLALLCGLSREETRRAFEGSV